MLFKLLLVAFLARSNFGLTLRAEASERLNDRFFLKQTGGKSSYSSG